MGDTRWAMSRITAHLAMADALRGASEPGLDARVGERLAISRVHDRLCLLALALGYVATIAILRRKPLT